MKYNEKLAFTAAAALFASVVVSHAQQQPAKPAPTDVPQRTTASYGDWVVQCVTNSSPPPESICDMAQVTQLQGKNLPFSRVAVGHPEKGQPVKLIVQVPINVSFAKQVHLQTADNDPGFVAPFATCTPNGCFAEFDLKDDMLKKLRDVTTVGKVTFDDAGNHDVAVPISFNGFGQAYDALAKK